MRAPLPLALGLLAAALGCRGEAAGEVHALTGTAPLTLTGDLSTQMVAGIDRFLTRATERTLAEREKFWRRDFASPEAYTRSVQPNRERLRTLIGAVDERVALTPASGFECPAPPGGSARLATRPTHEVWRIRWPVFEGVHGEGLWLQPKSRDGGQDLVAAKPASLPCVVAIPDADQTPEMLAGLAAGLPPASQFARRLAEAGCTVLVLELVNRQDTHSGNPKLGRFTNQPHREWIYRQAFEMGRHIIGYEVQKALAAVDRLAMTHTNLAVAGYGEGGLIALYAAALEPRLRAALVSGYFDSRQQLWQEPIYRNVFGLLREFGDAEIASLIAPRPLIVEYSPAPPVDGPPAPRDGRRGAAPGRLVTPDFLSVEAEVNRANELTRALRDRPPVDFVHGAEGMAVRPGSERALLTLLEALGHARRALPEPAKEEEKPASSAASGPETPGGEAVFIAERQRRAVRELEEHTQRLFRQSERARDALVWNHLKGPGKEWDAICATHRARLWEEVIGKLTRPSAPLNPRTRRIHDKPKWTGYEVMLDVLPDVFAWGCLLLPKDLQPGERRPVVVCQHGLDGLPEDVITDDPKSHGFGPYQAFAARLAERGFIVYAPYNPYRGGDRFRVLQRKANPLGLSLFSFIIAQHETLLDWLGGLPFVDPARIGFYGLSYGGKTAMRVPAVLERYALSICSADFNEWIQKNVTVDAPYSYLFTGEYEMPEWNLGHTFNYAEMAALIAPRPFMVERGHFDGVAPDTWVAYEYAKVRRAYTLLGIAERTEIEFFNGPHQIHGVGTFRFLHRHLNWPEPK